jgi:hypothetical protein
MSASADCAYDGVLNTSRMACVCVSEAGVRRCTRELLYDSPVMGVGMDGRREDTSNRLSSTLIHALSAVNRARISIVSPSCPYHTRA